MNAIDAHHNHMTYTHLIATCHVKNKSCPAQAINAYASNHKKYNVYKYIDLDMYLTLIERIGVVHTIKLGNHRISHHVIRETAPHQRMHTHIYINLIHTI